MNFTFIFFKNHCSFEKLPVTLLGVLHTLKQEPMLLLKVGLKELGLA